MWLKEELDTRGYCRLASPVDCLIHASYWAPDYYDRYPYKCTEEILDFLILRKRQQIRREELLAILFKLLPNETAAL